jgi:formate transporter
LATLVLTDNSLGYGLGRLTAGLAFGLGLIMLVLAGGELFTGNNLMILALASRKVSMRSVVRNWTLVFAANAAGSILLALAIHYSGILESGNVKATAIKIAEAKAHLGSVPAFIRGALCNMLVCLAVWMSVAARSLEGKVIAIIFPIGAFVALGFEHCIANFYFIPIGMMSSANVSLLDFLDNIVAVTLGNVAGGGALAIAYWFVYLADKEAGGQDLSTGMGRSPSKTDLMSLRSTTPFTEGSQRHLHRKIVQGFGTKLNAALVYCARYLQLAMTTEKPRAKQVRSAGVMRTTTRSADQGGENDTSLSSDHRLLYRPSGGRVERHDGTGRGGNDRRL